jgi:hypothetical protein
MKRLTRAALQAATLAFVFASATYSWGQAQVPVSLFKIITVKDEVVVGLNTQELQALGGPEKAPAGIIASALAGRKELTVWQYAVHKAANGDSEMAPLHQIGVLSHDSLRVVPYSTPFAILPHN